MPELPEDVLDRAEKLTRVALAAEDERADRARGRRDRLLAELGFHTREREAGERTVLVCYPEAWVEDGTVRPERVEDTDEAVEIPIGGGASPADWESVAEHNEAIADRVASTHGDPHGATAQALAEYASNHYAKPVEDLTAAECERFVTEYLPRNAWPTDEQLAVVDASLRRIFEETDAACPLDA